MHWLLIITTLLYSVTNSYLINDIALTC